MSAAERFRRWWRIGKRVVLGHDGPRAPGDEAAWQDAVSLWNALFQPFSPLTDDADVLELGCGDGRLLGAVATTGKARSAVGFERRAWWAGYGDGVAWASDQISGLELHADLAGLHALDEGGFDLVLCRELDSVLSLDELEDGLSRLYEILRPGGEAILRARCAPASGGALDGPGYGFMTPTAWISLAMRAGFEPASVRRVWRDPSEQGAAARRLPGASDDERLAAEVRMHLIRPWEAWELDVVRDFGDQGRRKKKKPA